MQVFDTTTYPPSPPPCETNCTTAPPPPADTGAPNTVPAMAGGVLALAVIGVAALRVASNRAKKFNGEA